MPVGTKLTEEQINRILKLVMDGVKSIHIADRLDVSRATVNSVWRKYGPASYRKVEGGTARKEGPVEGLGQPRGRAESKT